MGGLMGGPDPVRRGIASADPDAPPVPVVACLWAVVLVVALVLFVALSVRSGS